MSDVAVTVDRVWKKFRRGELHDSLRDAVPALARRLFGGKRADDALGAREFWALHDVSFELKRGEALGIIGPNGAGKSTLLKTLCRIIRPTLGNYRVNGRLRALIEVAAGFHGDLTGRENIFLNGTILGMSRDEIGRKLDQIIDFSGIESFIDTPVKRYSSGMQARLGFSVAAHLDPEILLVDEVLAVGDAVFRSKCLTHMEKLVTSDVSVIFISHNLEQVRQLCQRCLVLQNGRIRYVGTTNDALNAYHQISRASPAPSQTAGVATRPGAGRVRIVAIDVIGDAGPVLFTGCPATIRFRLNAHVSDLVCRFAFLNEHSEHIAYFESSRTAPNDLQLTCSDGPYIDWTCTELPLLPGRFSINVVLDTPDGIVQDRLTLGAQFEVQGSRWHDRLVSSPLPYGSVTFKHYWTRAWRADTGAAPGPRP